MSKHNILWLILCYSFAEKNVLCRLLHCVAPGCREFLGAPFVLVNPGSSTGAVTGYERILALSQSYLLSANPKEVLLVETELLRATLRADGHWSVRFTADYWSFMARYGSSEFCLQHVTTLIHVAIGLRQRGLAHTPPERTVAHVLWRLSSFLSTKGFCSLESTLSTFKDENEMLGVVSEVNISKLGREFKNDLHHYCFEVKLIIYKSSCLPLGVILYATAFYI